ncbi:MAG: tetratricopeptide repeat protein [Acidiferrobacter sp.]
MTPDIASYVLSHASRAGVGRPFDDLPTRLLFLYIVIANGVLALGLARPMAHLLPPSYREHQASWLLAVIIAAIPGLGLLIALFIAAGITRLASHSSLPEPQTLGLPAFGAEMRGRQRHMGAGGAWAILRAKDAGVARGVRALLSLDPRLSRQTSPLVRSALRHPEEDLRLLAYGLLDRREGNLSEAISEALTRRQSPGPQDDEGLLEKRLAFLYWELLYQDLSRDHLRQHAIRRAQTHALAALKRRPNDPTLHVLMGRIAMLEGHYLAARTHCERALDLNAAPGQILPYLAETRFRLGDFAALKLLARDYPSLCDVPTIGPVVRFWNATP